MINIYTGPAIGNVVRLHQVGGPAVQALRTEHVPRWRAGGLTAGVLQMSAWDTIGMVLSEIDRSEGELVLLRTAEDHRRLPEGAYGIWLSVEGYTPPFAGDLDALHTFAALGVTAFTFSHNAQNVLATGVGDRAGEGGFTHLGKATLDELRDLPILVDLVHLSRASFWDALELYDGDVLVSHSNAAAVCGHPRNLTDDQIRAVAERGGVIGLNTYRGYVADDPLTATLSDLLDHALHICELVGPEHLAVGADYWEAPMELLAPTMAGVDPDGSQGLAAQIYAHGPEGIEDAGRLGALERGLAERGLAADEVDLVCGGAYLALLDRADWSS